MAFSKRTTALAIAIMAALSLEIGCGAGTHQQSRQINHTLKASGKNLPGNNSNKGPGKNLGQFDTNVDEKITNDEKELQRPTTSTKEELETGSYALNQVTSVLRYMDSSSAGLTKNGMHAELVSARPLGTTTLQNSKPTITGKASQLTDSTGRKITVPLTFTAELGKGPVPTEIGLLTNRYDQASNNVIDSLDSVNDTNANASPSFIDILSHPPDGPAGRITYTDDTIPASVKGLNSNAKVEVQLMKSDQGLRVLMTFTETADKNSQKTFSRAIYLEYQKSADDSTNGAGQTSAPRAQNPADPAQTVTSIAPGSEGAAGIASGASGEASAAATPLGVNEQGGSSAPVSAPNSTGN